MHQNRGITSRKFICLPSEHGHVSWGRSADALYTKSIKPEVLQGLASNDGFLWISRIIQEDTGGKFCQRQSSKKPTKLPVESIRMDVSSHTASGFFDLLVPLKPGKGCLSNPREKIGRVSDLFFRPTKTIIFWLFHVKEFFLEVLGANVCLISVKTTAAATFFLHFFSTLCSSQVLDSFCLRSM